MDEEHLALRKEYIFHYQPHFDRYLEPLVDPSGKRILIVGCGDGAETFWTLSRGASFVLGLDPYQWPTDPLLQALSERGIEHEGRFEHRTALTTDIRDGEFEPFDIVMSHNVMEHVFELSHVLASCKRFIPGSGKRMVIFADPLYYSSAGAHLDHVGVPPWGHLTQSQKALSASVPPGEWNHYRRQLNGMTLTSFLDAVREAGLWVEKLGIVADRNLTRYSQYADMVPSGIKPFDLLCEGVFCVLGFPENI